MLKGCLLCAGISVAGLLAASCAATPQTLAAQAAEAAATQAVVVTTQVATNIYNAATQAVANAAVGRSSAPIPGFAGRRLIIDTPTATYIQQPNGQLIIVNKPPAKPKYSNGDPMD